MERLRPQDPNQIGPWSIINRLGAGGMGVVYMGTYAGQSAAIKTIREHLLEDPTSRVRLQREVESLQRIHNDNVVEIIDSDIQANPAWIATRFIDGPSLKTMIELNGALDEIQWLSLAIGLTSAVSSVHKVGVIHRDIKPSNILMSKNGPVLIDFGISHTTDATALTRTGVVAGTPAWFAPEQFETDKLTTSIDDFAVGSVLYFAATGKIPWGNEDTSVAYLMHKILMDSADLSTLNDIQKQVIIDLHKKLPNERKKSIEIKSWLENRATQLPQSQNRKRQKRFSRIKVALISATLLSLSISFVFISSFLDTSILSKPNNASTFQKPIKWSLQIEDDSQPTQGEGNSYSAFICDQSVVKNSLKIQEITNPPAEVTPTLTLLKADARCGSDFDTIQIDGQIDNNKIRREYIIAGSTSYGILFQYKFTISIIN